MNPRINIDDLYETKKKNDLNRLDIYNKLLLKIHSRIKTASRIRNSEHFCHFIMPEILIGLPNYNLSDCLIFVIDCLEKDGFLTRYVHPNLLLISWNHWIPVHVREEYKKKTGISINSYGEQIQKDKNIVRFSDKTENYNSNSSNSISKFTSIYDEELINSIKKI
jgi:hypothetical protein